MDNSKNNDYLEEIEVLTLEEEEKIYNLIPENQKEFESKNENVQNASEPLFNLNAIGNAILVTNKVIPFDFGRKFGFNKVVKVNNISGKNVWLVITPCPITCVETFGAEFHNISFNVSLSEKGEYKTQQIPIMNNTSSLIELDNSKFYCTLYIDIDGKLVQSWDNRKFNSKNYDINILERHVTLAKQIPILNLHP